MSKQNIINPNVADLRREKTRQSAPDVAARRLGEDEAYLTVPEIRSEASTVADGVLWRERSGFGRWEVCDIRVKYWFEKAQYYIASARDNLSAGRLPNAVRDAYFACFHVFTAVLFKE